MHHVDIFTTILSIVDKNNANINKVQGINMLNKRTKHKQVYWKSGHYSCIRNGKWKLSYSERPEKYWFYNLNEDPFEQYNILDSQNISSLNSELLNILKQLKESVIHSKTSLWNSSIEIPIPINSNGITSLEDEYVYWAN